MKEINSLMMMMMMSLLGYVDHDVNCNFHVTVGLGFKINFPVLSQDMLKSCNTCLTLEVIIDGATTLLWMPARNKLSKIKLLNVKTG